MNSFGLSNESLNLLKNIIQDVFGTDSDLKVYIFGSRATGKNKKNSDIDLAFKSKDKDLNLKIQKVKNYVEESDFPYKFDILNWDEILKEYLPKIKKEKKKFWSKDDVLIHSPWRPCPLGYHWVKEHLKKGNVDPTNPHCRKNPSKKDILKVDEIHKITENSLFKNPTVKAKQIDLGFKNGNKFDYLINGWCAYWNDIFKVEPPLHPNHVKALIATESGFQIKPKVPAGHTAIGITQIMPKTITLLSPRSRELKNHYIEVTREEMLDATVNICSSIRWLFRKRELILRRRSDADWLDTIEEYKGISKQNSKKPKRIKSDIKEFYEILSH